jgi:hypothetical protein
MSKLTNLPHNQQATSYATAIYYLLRWPSSSKQNGIKQPIRAEPWQQMQWKLEKFIVDASRFISPRRKIDTTFFHGIAP